jgi:hypothetical protein
MNRGDFSVQYDLMTMNKDESNDNIYHLIYQNWLQKAYSRKLDYFLKIEKDTFFTKFYDLIEPDDKSARKEYEIYDNQIRTIYSYIFINEERFDEIPDILDSNSFLSYYISQTEAGKNVYEPFFDQYFVEKGGIRFFRHEGVIKLKPYVTELLFNKIYFEIKQGNFGEAQRLNKVLKTLFSNASNFQNNMLRRFNPENEIKTLDFYYLYWSQVKVNQHFDQEGSERNFINLVKQLSVLNFLTTEQSKFFLFLIEEQPEVKDQFEYVKVLHKATKSFLENYGKKSYYYGKCMFLLAEHYSKANDEENLKKAKEYLEGNEYFNSDGFIKEKK